jgi:hypothetical protein
VRFQVAQISILRRVLFLVRHVNQKVEAIAIRIARDDCLELLFVQQEQFPDGFAKRAQKAPALAAKCRAGLGRLPFRIRILNTHA